MRWLAEYLRQVFCRHEYVAEEAKVNWKRDLLPDRKGTRISLTCTKCSYHRSYWKFGSG